MIRVWEQERATTIMDMAVISSTSWFLPRYRVDELISLLHQHGFRVTAPIVEHGAIIYREITTTDQLPVGIGDFQTPGQYNLTQANHVRWFAWANGPQALKPLLFAARETLWRVRRDESGRLAFEPVLPEVQPTAVFGVRACDLAALALQDQHFLQQAQADPHYARRREHLALIALNCTHPAATCFCASTGDGPRAKTDFDLAMTELDEGFVVTIGTGRGQTWLHQLDLAPALPEQIAAADQQIEQAARQQQRTLPDNQRASRLLAALDHPQWDDVAARCLSCGNCTSVCPTCFCSNVFTESGVSLSESHQEREWDSCFTTNHSHIHGLTIRPDTRLRYRQWLVHKLATWETQYGRSGCVGCGRCLTWCPAAIDLTAECQKLLT